MVLIQSGITLKLSLILNDVAYNDVGTRINTKNVGRFDEDCRKSIKVKNEVRKKCIIRDTRVNKEDYKKRTKLVRSVQTRKEK